MVFAKFPARTQQIRPQLLKMKETHRTVQMLLYLVTKGRLPPPKYRSRFGAVSDRPSEKAAWLYYVLYQESGYSVRRIQYGY